MRQHNYYAFAPDSNTIYLISVAPQNGEVTHHSRPPSPPASTVIQRPYRHHDQLDPHQPPRHPQHGTVSNRLPPPDQVRARIVDHKDSSKVARTPPLPWAMTQLSTESSDSTLFRLEWRSRYISSCTRAVPFADAGLVVAGSRATAASISEEDRSQSLHRQARSGAALVFVAVKQKE